MSPRGESATCSGKGRATAEPLLSEKLIAISHVKRACLRACLSAAAQAGDSTHRQAAEEGVTRARLEEMGEGIERDVGKFKELLAA